MKVLVGCDPELFAFDSGTGRFVSGHDLIPGTKKEPYRVRGGAVQVDGVALEFNINPASSFEEFNERILCVQDEMQSIVDGWDRGYTLVASPTALFDPEYFASLPFEAKLLGCEPDFNAQSGKQNDPPSTDLPMRTGGGHIHLGWTEFVDPFDPHHFQVCCEIVRLLDEKLYPLSLKWDTDEQRRTLYGGPSAFRPKHYGLEYRSLSNAWVQKETSRFIVYEVSKKVVEDYFRVDRLKGEDLANTIQ